MTFNTPFTLSYHVYPTVRKGEARQDHDVINISKQFALPKQHIGSQFLGEIHYVDEGVLHSTQLQSIHSLRHSLKYSNQMSLFLPCCMDNRRVPKGRFRLCKKKNQPNKVHYHSGEKKGVDRKIPPSQKKRLGNHTDTPFRTREGHFPKEEDSHVLDLRLEIHPILWFVSDATICFAFGSVYRQTSPLRMWSIPMDMRRSIQTT